jgi:SAM-dependent methyltransferase
MDLLPILKGLATYVVSPNSKARGLLHRAPHGGGRSAKYCYGVWLKHAVLLGEQGCTPNAGHIAEFGPGESLGVGLAALLSGAQTYSAFDAVAVASFDHSSELLDDLAQLLSKRAGRPTRGWPNFDHLLDENFFPSGILADNALEASLRPQRIAALRDALDALARGEPSSLIRYQAPWNATAVMDGTIDVIFSHSVLQYVEDLDAFYSECRRWLKPDGWMSHHIDLSSMNVTRVWNAHWSYSPRLWKTVRGARPFFLTARTSSDHVAAMQRNGFRLCKVDRAMEQGIARQQLSEDRRGMSDEDLDCKSMFAIAQKVA